MAAVRVPEHTTVAGLSWRRMASLAAAADAIVLFLVGIPRLDRDALAFAVLFLLGLGLLRFRGGLLGRVLLALLFLDVAAFMLAGTISNIGDHEQLSAVVVPALLAAISLPGFIATVAAILKRKEPGAGGTAPRTVALAGLAGFVLALAVPVVPGLAEQKVARSGDIVLRTKNTAFSRTSIDTKSGPVTVYVTNEDLFWHTFSIDALGVDVAVPVGGHRRVTFTATPGTTYTYYCRVPGHEQAGMHGTLTVR